jgi:hypothetical protein
MSQQAGVWIDHRTAVIVVLSAGQVTTKTLESEVEAHPHYSGRQGSGGEKKYEQRHEEQLDRYYDSVIEQVGRPEGILIFGPGEAKLELKARFDRSRALPEFPIKIDTADKLTEPQIVARVKQHFVLAR